MIWRQSRSVLVGALFALSGFLGSQRIGAETAVAAPQSGSVDAATAASTTVSKIIAAGGDASDAAAAVAEAFAWAGVATYADDTSQTRAAMAPTIPVRLFNNEAQTLALDARTRASGGWRLSLDELAVVLQGLGWQAPAGRPAGATLVQVLGEAIRAARQAPSSPNSFVPLFLQAMSSATSGPDLASGAADPVQVRLSLMEMELLLAAHLRGSESYGAVTTAVDLADRPAPNEGELTIASQATAAEPARLAAQTPCGDLEDDLGLFKSVHLVSLDRVTSVPMDMLYERLKLQGMNRFAVSKALSLIKLFAQMHGTRLMIDAAPEEQHYSHGHEANTVLFLAHAEVPDVTDDPRVKAVSDCLNALGFPAPDDLAAQFKEWRMLWDFSGLNPHATWGLDDNHFDFPGQQAAYLDEHGYHTVSVDMRQEEEEVHRDGVLRSGTMSVAAKLDTSAASISPPINVVMGDLPSALLDLASSFYQRVGGPSATKVVAVTWHEPRAATWRGTITYVERYERTDNLADERQRQILQASSLVDTSTTKNTRKATVHVSGAALTCSTCTMEAQVNNESRQERHFSGIQDCGVTRQHVSWSRDDVGTTHEHAEIGGGAPAEVVIAVGSDNPVSVLVSVSFSSPALEGTSESEVSWSANGMCNPAQNGTKVSNSTAKLFDRITASFTTTLDPGNPRQLKGSQRQPLGNDGLITIDWDLSED